MNNLKKIGLSALAGSLVAFSANAVEMGVSGTAEITYATLKGDGTAGVTTGSPWGSNTSLKFSGSGNVGWADVTLVRTINDKLGSAYLSAYQTMDMGDLGTLSLDAIGGGLEGVTAYDDKLPTAYEEVWNGVSGSGISGAASNDTLGYSNSFGPISVSLATSKSGGVAASTDGGVGAEPVTGTISDVHVTLDASMLLDGLTVMAGTSTTDYTNAGDQDDTAHVGHILYSTGPVSVGYRMGAAQSGTASTAGQNIEAMSVAFAVNDNMSISVGTQDNEYDTPSGANITESVDAISASYTVGAASIRMHRADSSNDGGVTGKDVEYMELSLVLAF
jgi:outer membrane protein OmpU